MRTKRGLQEVDPLCLLVGTRVGPWRVTGWGGRGAYGTLYRVAREGHEAQGEFALKLAVHPGDERFGREAELLRCIASPHVPRLRDQGVWKHPAGAFPYVVMEWVEGEVLYDWAAKRNPTSRQILRLLAQVARALAATHEVGGAHRDVKGDNVLVRTWDGQAVLMDFGAGHYKGAVTLTSKLLPPGTLAYRSPEAWAFVNAFLRHPTAHYPASACDDLFALGVMAYRLVTDEYPPSTQPGESSPDIWRQGGAGPRAPRELNPRVSPELEAIIMRLLAITPVERFGGQAREAAEALEQAAEGPGGDEPLFTWAHELRPRWRSPGGARFAAEQEAAARQEHALREAEARTQACREQASTQAVVQVRRAAAAVGLLVAGLTVAVQLRSHETTGSASGIEARKGGRVAVGDNARAGTATKLTEDKKRVVGLPMPEQPLPGQSKPPCKRTGEVEIRGGCWYPLRDAKPPCKEEGKEDAYVWKGGCYGPSYPVGREPTSSPP